MSPADIEGSHGKLRPCSIVTDSQRGDLHWWFAATAWWLDERCFAVEQVGEVLIVVGSRRRLAS
jgi:hypothetical protein